MKNFSITEYRETFYPFINKVSNSNMLISKYKDLKKIKFDFDVYLPTLGINLQRGFIWKTAQKQEFILSLFKELVIPPVSIIIDDSDSEYVYQVIDGKQRIKSILDFIDNSFPVIVNDFEIYFDDLDRPSKTSFLHKPLLGLVMFSNNEVDPLSDQQKIQWFNYINFTGTPQDKKHKEYLMRALGCLK